MADPTLRNTAGGDFPAITLRAVEALAARITVDEEDGFTELLIDGEAVYGGNGSETSVIREFGVLCEAVRTGRALPPPMRDDLVEAARELIATIDAGEAVVSDDDGDGPALTRLRRALTARSDLPFADLLKALRVARAELHHPGACRMEHGEDVADFLDKSIQRGEATR